MNTVRSTWLGWGALCVAGGGAYYFAKQSINADRQSRYDEERGKQERLKRLEASGYARDDPTPKKKKAASHTENAAARTRGLDHAGSPSSEISEDAAPVGHAPVDNDQKMREKSKYEAAEPYRSKKGDRFS